MKKITLLILVLTIPFGVFAQKNFYRLSVGAGAGGALAFADLKKKTISFAGYGSLDYLITPYVSLGLEGQKGELAGGDIVFDANNRQFINSYLSGSVNLKVSFGEFISDFQRRIPIYNFLSGVYAGVGLGVMKNKISNVRYYDENYFPGDDTSTEEIVPINLGYNVVVPDRWGYGRYGFNVNFQTTLTLGEGLDGYTPIVNGNNDLYNYLSVGFRYHFGLMGLDKRR